ncbi:hypothetical protein C7M84_000387 [Penaeus vannamei]|uniref:Uncharacterized protein n=1 Tax=Penaeus vannamei TaxID=6689 RepID=A0A423TWN9_PENVA|nr:hypothetical protein C7M84_000387 [Penaeus vannamei]
MAQVPLRMAQPGLVPPHQQRPPMMVSMTQPPPVSMQAGLVSMAPMMAPAGGMAVMTQAMSHPDSGAPHHTTPVGLPSLPQQVLPPTRALPISVPITQLRPLIMAHIQLMPHTTVLITLAHTRVLILAHIRVLTRGRMVGHMVDHILVHMGVHMEDHTVMVALTLVLTWDLTQATAVVGHTVGHMVGHMEDIMVDQRILSPTYKQQQLLVLPT